MGNSENMNHHHEGKNFVAPAFSFAMLLVGMVMSHYDVGFFNRIFMIFWYAAALIPVGLPVVIEAWQETKKHDFFNEFTLMTIACIGAFCIGEYPEAVGIMLFYTIGETLQHKAVARATRNITDLIDRKSDKVSVVRNGKAVVCSPESINVGDLVEVHPGERVPVDGLLTENGALFDTSALTGESVPRFIDKGKDVLSGMISADKTVVVKATHRYADSTLSHILDLVANARDRKAHTELFIRRFARIYTPVVIALAFFVVAVPALVSVFDSSFDYVFSVWLYRALVFLVISCPCALVISVPLGYFAGIGAASRKGILFKGGNYLETLARIRSMAFDKTGTLTEGRFCVEKVESTDIPTDTLLSWMASAEAGSLHPLAKAFIAYVEKKGISFAKADAVKEKAGFGVEAEVGGRKVTAGNLRMLDLNGISYPEKLKSCESTVIVCAVDGKYVGYAAMADNLKPDAVKAVDSLRKLGVEKIVMLSGDKKEIVERYARRLGMNAAFGELLPQQKAEYVKSESEKSGGRMAFVGDGLNDAPVLAISDVGIAMGGMGSDAAIESADVVIQTDEPSRVATAIRIGRTTHAIVTENIVGAITVKVIVMALGVMGYATLWGAVFADVGVALLAVVNSMRIMWKKY